MAIIDVDEAYEGPGEKIPVKLPSGATFVALTDSEADGVLDRVRRYHEDFELTNISDQVDVDMVICQEMLIQRWNNWLTSGRDYNNGPIADLDLPKRIKESGGELRMLKKQLGIDKGTRDKLEGDDSVPQFIDDLLLAAREFGINREMMGAKSIELAMELIHVVGRHRRSTEDEQITFHLTKEDVLTWIEEVFEPEFMAIDEYFREHKQKYWVEKV